VGDQFAFGVEQHGPGPDLSQWQVADGLPGGADRVVQGLFGVLDGVGGGGVDGGPATVAGPAGAGCGLVDRVGEAGVRVGQVGAGGADRGEGLGLGGVGDGPVGVVGGVGVGVEGVEREVLAGVFEVVRATRGRTSE